MSEQKIKPSAVSQTGSPRELFDRDLAERPWEQSPSVIEFWSFRCETCRLAGVVSSDLAKDHASAVMVYKVNVDNNPRLAAALGVTVLPSAALFRKGRLVTWLRNHWRVEDVLANLQP